MPVIVKESMYIDIYVCMYVCMHVLAHARLGGAIFLRAIEEEASSKPSWYSLSLATGESSYRNMYMYDFMC